MPYMGSIAPDSEVDVRFLASDKNALPATLTASLGYGQVEAGVPTPVVAPGSSRSVSMSTGHGGMLRIHVEFEGGIGGGELEVRVRGAVRDVGEIKNETWWMYTVEMPMPVHASGRNEPTIFHDSRQSPRD